MELTDEPITISTFDGLTLKGYLAKPTGIVHGVALLISGGGQVGEDGDVSSPFVGSALRGQPAQLNWQLRDCLGAHGIATLRYTKRPAATQSISNLVADARLAFEILRKRYPSVPTSIVGFSEGAIVATLLAETPPVDCLHLISLALRPIDEILEYQFVDWGVKLLEQKLDRDRDGFVTKSDFFEFDLTTLPANGVPVANLPFDSQDRISIQDGIRPVFQAVYQQLRGLLETPDLKTWYSSIKEMADLRQVLANLSCPIHFYQGSLDSQLNPAWLIDDHAASRIHGKIHSFQDLGHAFAPMEGAIGEKKTSGPFAKSLLNQISQNLKPWVIH